MHIKISAHHIGRIGLLAIALAAATTAFAMAFVIRLLIGPISLGPFDNSLRLSLSHALPGLTVRFEDTALEWSMDEDRLNLVILGARVLDERGRIIAQAPKAEVGLAVGQFLGGHIEVQRIALVGVQLTLVHGKDGVLRLGIGGGQEQSDVIQRIRDAIAHSGSGAASLNNFAISKARLAFYEQQTGAFVVAPEADLQITKSSGRSANGAIKANVAAQIEISGKPARLVAVLHLPGNGGAVTGDVSISGIMLSSLAANTKFFGFLAPFDVRSDVTGSFVFKDGTQLASADFRISAAGTVAGLGRPLHVRAFRVTGRFDSATGRVLIEDATLEGIQARAHMAGSSDLFFDKQGALSRATLSLKLDKLAFNMPGVMGQSVSVARAAIRGSYLPDSGTFAIEQGVIYGGPLSAKFSGHIQTANGKSPEIDMDGTVAALGVRDLLRFWPLQIGDGARRWIDANVSTGRIGPVLVHTHILPGMLDQPALPEDALSVTFPIHDATVSYIRGLTPLNAASGTATLSGDTFKADVDQAAMGPLSVSAGHVVIPNLHLHGASGEVHAHVDGTVQQVLALIDEKPLNYPSRFQIRTASAKGLAAIDLSVRIPMLHTVTVNDVGISVRAVTSNFGLALSDHVALSNGSLDIDVDNQTLRAKGNVTLGDSSIGVDWTEALAASRGADSTHLKVDGQLDSVALATLGIDASEYTVGPVGISGELDGRRGKIGRAQLKLDLTPAAVSVKMLGFRKPAGSSAQAQLNVRMDDKSNVRAADFVLSGPALAAHGSARFSPGGSLQSLDVPSFRSDGNDDFALNLTRDPVQGVSVALNGRSFDAEDLFHAETKAPAKESSAKSAEAEEAYRISARLDRVVMRQGVVLSAFSLNVNGAGARPRMLALNAVLSKNAQLTGRLTDGEDGAHIKLTAGDTGLLFKGLFGSSTLKGGTLALDAVMTNPSPKGGPMAAEYTGKFTITDFTVIDQPFLTRLFAAGSFGGLANLLGGKGIGLDSLDVPFTLRDEVLTIRDGRATGPSLGLSADGYYDFASDKLALQGAFAPLFGINGIWGSIPVIGNVLVSKQGEGLLGVTYSASGTADNPSVFVNPLSVLMPGILRRIFQGNPPTVPPPQADSVGSPTPTPAPKPQ